ncbi:protease stability complex PrcB-like protein [Gillisia sp. Hel_I_86]|uniref:protease complex subunit PrcB family protein n=1 Tax=Gillisia sp. Hel_I_86 TaxID=1249981 RepID=UPI00119B8377|nr:protease complex subunit PrcB family protein [Gillisia sp. Hel_I_86]TVZ25129.1 protease stability complex PrcB-like protein [Gillisia sp. Hel_I_86]
MKAFILILTTVISLSCSDDNNSLNTNIKFTEIAEGFLGGQGSEGIPKQNIVIENETDWNNLKTKMNTNVNTTESFSETAIDFSKFNIIAIFEEVKNSGEFHLSIDEIIKKPNNVFVKIKLESPSGPNVIDIITQPYYIAKIPKSDLPVIFQ